MVLSEFAKIRAVFLDVDGVLTDGTVTVTEQGEQLRRFSIKDGYAIQLAVKKGLFIVVITGGKSQGILLRLEGLGVKEVHLGVSDKLTLMQSLIRSHGFAVEETLFMGDDMPDFDCMQAVGLPVCPNDAVEEIKTIAKYVSPKRGGEGCVRDVLEKILKLQGLWQVDTQVKSI